MSTSPEKRPIIPKEVYKRKIHDKYTQVISPSSLQKGKKYLIWEFDEVIGHVTPLSEPKKDEAGNLKIDCIGHVNYDGKIQDFDSLPLEKVGLVPSPLTKFWIQNLWLQDPERVEKS